MQTLFLHSESVTRLRKAEFSSWLCCGTLGESLSSWGLSSLIYKVNSLKWSLRVPDLAFCEDSGYTVLWGVDAFGR